MDNEEIQGVKFSEFPSATPGDSDEVVGLHAGDNARFSVANFVLAIRQGLANIFVPKTDVGAAGGVAELDSTGKVPSSQLPPISSDASDITYDPTTSGLTATNVQDAIDEVYGDIPSQASDIGAQDEITASGILKGDGQGGVSAAVSGTDYQAPLTAGTDYATPAQLDGKANQSQLAYVETGTTASRNYTAGQYISLNGLLYTADTAIASGATLYTSGGNKNLTECVGGGFNNIRADVTPTSELIGTGHTLIRCGKLRILTVSFYVGTAAITIPVADRPTTAAVGFAVYNDLNSAQMTVGTVTVNTDGSIAFHSWQSYNTSTPASNVTSRWVNCPGVIWMTA